MTGGSGGEGALDRALWVLHRAEDAVLAALLGAMILLAPLQIFLRVFFDQGLTWADPLIRVLVLWVGLFGAVSASRGDRHITIDVISRMLPERLRAALGFVVHAFTTSVCAVLAWHSWRFVQDEREFGSIAFLGIPTWILELVLPFAFAMIAIRYLLHTLDEGGLVLGIRMHRPRRDVGGDHG